MEKKEYSFVTNLREAAPRSKRKQGTGGGNGGGTAINISVANSVTESDCDGHSHDNKPVLDAQSMDDAGYLYVRHKADGSEESITEKVKAGYADESAIANDLAADSPVRRQFISRVNADSAEGHITFEDGLTATRVNANDGNIDELVTDNIQSTTYTSGIGGKGYEIKMEDGESSLTVDNELVRGNAQVGGNASVGGQLTTDNITSSDYNGEFTGFTLKDTEGGSYLEVDKLNVRKKAVFRELDIKKIDHIGGANVTSPASCKIASVTTEASAYKCYFNATDGDKTIHNEWKVGDQALCHAFNLTTPRYYWRLVTAVSAEPTDGYHWVALSITDCDTDSDVPMAEDTIVCFGNRTDADRQSVIIMDSEGASAPYLRQLKGINSYNISDANIVTQLSPTKNIIRGEQIELTTSSGNKGLMDIANETLASAKTYADGVGTNATSTAKSYADGLFADAESYIQEREAYLQTQITANDEEIALRATKVEVQTVSDNVGALATRVTGAEASIKTNADNIALKAAKTEVDTIKTDLGNVTSRVSTAEAAIQVNANNITQRVTKTEYEIGITNANLLATAISKGVNLRTDCTFKEGVNKLWAFSASTITRIQIDGIPNDSGYGIEIKKTGTDSKYGFSITQKPKANKIYVVRFVAKVPSGKTIYFIDYNYNGTNAVRKWLSSDKGTGDWQEYVYYIKTDSTVRFAEHGFFYISDTTTEPPIWYLAYFAIYDATAFENYTTLTEFNTEITQLSDSINLKASKTEVQGKFDNLQVGQRNYAPNTSVAMTAYQFRDCYYPDNFRNKTAKITYRATYNITALPTGSYAGIQVHITYNDGTQSWIGAGVNDGITVGTATNKLIKKTIPVENKKVWRFRVYCQFKEGATGTFSIDQLMVNPDTFADWSPAPEDTADSIDKLGTRVTTAESSLTVQSNRISSVVSEQESMIKEYGFSDFVHQELTWDTTSQGSILGKMNAQADNYHYLKLTNVKAGDVVRFELNDKLSGALVYSLFGCDGDGQGAWEASGHSTAADEWLGFMLYEINHDNEVVSESVIKVDSPELYVYLSDDFGNKSKIKVYLIRAKMTAQSRIDQTADNIRLQVGEAGINLDTKVITLDASKTIVTGDLAVRTVKTYWDAAQTQLKSAYNGNGEGTIVYYYPNGQVMKEDTFVTDSKGNVQGMRTTYYKADGSVAWTINEGGFMTTLPDYWTVLNNGNDLRYTTDVDTMMEMLKQYLTDAMKHFSAAKFSRFVSQSGNYKNYNGKVSKAVRSSETPTDAMLWAGVLVYSVELYEDGWNPTYIVTYEVCTTRLGQIGLKATKKFNSLGEVK